jgi:hypothetical protein
MIALTVDRAWRVTVLGEIELPMPVDRAWQHVRDFASFTTFDPFHARVHVVGGLPRVGSSLRIDHRFGPVRLRRRGRILRWQEGVGYAFSDLSERGARRGFPHVYSYRVVPIGCHACRLSISVRGRWTAKLLPRWAAKLWVGWVMAMTLGSVIPRLLLPPGTWRTNRQASSNAQAAPNR